MQMQLANKLNNKSISRIATIQAIYQLDNLEDKDNINPILNQIISFYKDPDINNYYDISDDNYIKIKPSYIHLKRLFFCTINNFNKINQIIESHRQKKNTINQLLYTILRVAVAEMIFLSTKPPCPKTVIINEYTNIAYNLLFEHEIGFVNSLLDKLNK